MSSLTAIVLLLCLALIYMQHVLAWRQYDAWTQYDAKTCSRNRGEQCVAHHLCNRKFGEEGPLVDFRMLQNGNKGCFSTQTCCPEVNVKEENGQDENEEPTGSECGEVNGNGISFTMRSANGLAQENEIPWMTTLLHTNGTFLGGGSLIALDVVLTAHHKVDAYDSSSIVVRAGDWDLSTDTEQLPFAEIGVRKIVFHPNFNRRNGANNLALLFLREPFKRSKNIRPICLPSRTQRFDRKRCFVTGWGLDAISQSSFMNIMKKVDLPVVSHRTCDARMKELKGRTFKLHSSLMCAGGEAGKDACTGDGGSPLACPLESDPNRFEQAGIVNWGEGCGEEGNPGVYTDVATFRSWIDEQISLDEQISHETDEGIHYPTTPNRPIGRPTNPGTKKPAVEIDREVLYGSPTTMGYEEDSTPMRIIKSG